MNTQLRQNPTMPGNRLAEPVGKWGHVGLDLDVKMSGGKAKSKGKERMMATVKLFGRGPPAGAGAYPPEQGLTLELHTSRRVRREHEEGQADGFRVEGLEDVGMGMLLSYPEAMVDPRDDE